MTEQEYATQKLAEQKARIRELEQEANYLARMLSDIYDPWHRDEETWRKIAREALEHD